jgi:hypothetical protein
LPITALKNNSKLINRDLKDFQVGRRARSRPLDRMRNRTNVANNLARFRRWAKSLMEVVVGRKKTEITIETNRLLIIRRRRTVRFWCQECGCEVEMISVAEAAALTGINRPVVGGCAEAQKWHFAESPDKATLICLESLRKFLQGSIAEDILGPSSKGRIL